MSVNISEKVAVFYGGEIAGVNEQLIETYWSWYRGFVEKFHNYRIYNGENFIYLTKKSLQMAKKVCETWADLLMNEKCDIKMNDEGKTDLDVIFKQTKFWTKANTLMEWSFALGYGALVGEITDKKKLKIVMLNAKHILPLRIENEEIIDCAFHKSKGKKTLLTVWQRDDNTNFYKVTSKQYMTDTGDEVPETEVILQTSITKPMFMIIKPNIVSNMEEHEDNFGVSVFSNAIDTLKALDTKYDNFDFEFIGGRKKVYVSDDAMKVVKSQAGSSQTVQAFDPLDSVYYRLSESDDGKPIVEEKSGELRSTQFIEAINTELSLLSHKVGLGYGYFKFDSKGMVTATQVISENGDLFRTLKKHEILIRDQMISFVQAMIEYSNAYCDLKVKNYKPDEIDVLFDDSIIEDTEAMQKEDLIAITTGMMTHVDFAKRWYAMNEKDARAKYLYLDIVHKANSVMPLLDAKLMTPEMAIDLIYGDKELKIDLASLKEYLQKDDLNIEDGEFDENKGQDDEELDDEADDNTGKKKQKPVTPSKVDE